MSEEVRTLILLLFLDGAGLGVWVEGGGARGRLGPRGNCRCIGEEFVDRSFWYVMCRAQGAVKTSMWCTWNDRLCVARCPFSAYRMNKNVS